MFEILERLPYRTRRPVRVTADLGRRLARSFRITFRSNYANAHVALFDVPASKAMVSRDDFDKILTEAIGKLEPLRDMSSTNGAINFTSPRSSRIIYLNPIIPTGTLSQLKSSRTSGPLRASLGKLVFIK
jgi:hypothetical protein